MNMTHDIIKPYCLRSVILVREMPLTKIINVLQILPAFKVLCFQAPKIAHNSIPTATVSCLFSAAPACGGVVGPGATVGQPGE